MQQKLDKGFSMLVENTAGTLFTYSANKYNIIYRNKISIFENKIISSDDVKLFDIIDGTKRYEIFIVRNKEGNVYNFKLEVREIQRAREKKL